MSRPGRFIPGKERRFLLNGVGPRVRLEVLEKKIACPYRDSIPGPSSE